MCGVDSMISFLAGRACSPNDHNQPKPEVLQSIFRFLSLVLIYIYIYMIDGFCLLSYRIFLQKLCLIRCC